MEPAPGRILHGETQPRAMKSNPNPSMAETRKILVPLDLPFQPQKSLTRALEIASRTPASVVLLHVFDPGSFLNGWNEVVWARSDEAVMCELQEHLQAMADRLAPPEVHIQCLIRKGCPAREILREARRASIALIILNGPRATGLAKWLRLGVAEKVFRHAPCPVALAHEDESANQGTAWQRTWPTVATTKTA